MGPQDEQHQENDVFRLVSIQVDPLLDCSDPGFKICSVKQLGVKCNLGRGLTPAIFGDGEGSTTPQKVTPPIRGGF